MKDALKQYLRDQIKLMNEILKREEFTDKDRMKLGWRLFAGICEECGRVTDKCHCMNDE